MTNHLQPSANRGAVVHLLDSAQGHPLQTWRFANQDSITIGRGDGNDIVLADPHVSRAHATISFDNDRWMIASFGRHGTLVNDRLVSEAVLTHQTVFRLGSGGPTLRFDTELLDTRRSETLDSIGPDLLEMLSVDESRKQEEVDQITSNALFQELREQSKRMRTAAQNDADAN